MLYDMMIRRIHKIYFDGTVAESNGHGKLPPLQEAHPSSKLPKDLEWTEAVEALAKLFGSKNSLFRKRFEVFSLRFRPNDNANVLFQSLKAKSVEAKLEEMI